MIGLKPRHVLVFLLVFLVTPTPVQRAQNDDVLTRENDDRATSIEQRQQALTSLLAAAQQYRSVDPVKAAAFLNRAARLQVRLNLSKQAITTYQDALTLLKPAPTSLVNIDTLNGLGAAYGHLSKCDEAQPFLDQAIALSEQTNNVAGKAEALVTRSDCQGYTDPALALQTAQTALELWRSIDNKPWIAETYAYLSDFQIAQHKLAEATASNQAALEIWRELNVPREQAGALISLGFIEYRKGSMQEALDLYGQARSLLDEAAEPYKLGQISNGMGEAFLEIGFPETGLAKFKEALEYFRRAENPRSAIDVSWHAGKAYYLLGNYSEAQTTLEQTIADAAAIPDRITEAMCHEFLGRTKRALNDEAAARTHFELALQLYAQGNKRREAARVVALVAQLEEQQGKVSQARSKYQSALQTFRSLADGVNESAVLYALGSMELRENNLEPAEEYLRQSIAVTEDLRRVSTSTDLTAAFSAAVFERYENYVECLMRKNQAHPSVDRLTHAFEISELARARSLAELLQATQTNLAPGVDPQLATQEKLLRQSLRTKENEKIGMLGKDYKREDLVALDQASAQLNSQYKQIVETIRARYPAYDQLSRPGAWPLQQIQEQVVADDQTVLLEYILGANKSYVWAVTRAGIKSYELPPQKVVNDAARKVYELIALEPTAETESRLSGAADELSKLILSPVAEQLNKQRIIVVADGALNYVPFQFLPAPAGNREQLVVNYEVINAPSASVLGQLRQETAHRQSAPNVLAAFGDPVFQSNYAQQPDRTAAQVATAETKLGSRPQAVRDITPIGDSFDPATIESLFYSKLELANLREVAGETTLLATGFEASTDRLRRTDLTKYAILHLATHGILDPKRPEKSGLILSTVNSAGQEQDGFVGLQDIYGLHAPVDLVVLSACRTGLGKDVRGEGLIGLTRGFIYAGSSSVVASLWKVNDEATAELMKRFYINMLQRGMRPAEALRAAQNSIRQEPHWRSPYYWAAFTLQGDYRQVIKPAPIQQQTRLSPIVVGTSLTLLLAAFVWWYWRFRPARLRS